MKQTLLHFQKVAFWANFCFENNENFLNTEKLETYLQKDPSVAFGGLKSIQVQDAWLDLQEQ